MKKYKFFLTFFMALVFSNLVQLKGSEFENSETIGYYTSGCIKNAAVLPRDGIGYQVIRLSRDRYYGHRELIEYIQSLGRKVQNRFGGILLIGDISQKNGGPLPDDHNSHQIGLDADILFWQHPVARKRMLTLAERERIEPLSLLTPDFRMINYNRWDPIHEEILRLAASYDNVDRIFVNPKIKRKLCERYSGQQWLRKIRPWWGHDGHFHIRLSCPDDSPLCESQKPLPLGDGCDEDLAMWFTKGVKQKGKSTPKKVRKLPIECLPIIGLKNSVGIQYEK
ncbi:MAG: penicillin-insensitive murein endopeptidase [Thermodesulfobacteriota bacterium]